MAQKTVWLPEIGEVVIAKRKGAKNIRLSISAAGKVRVGLPQWAPYAAGISFAKSRTDWINQHINSHQPKPLIDGGRIGKSYRLNYIYTPKNARTTTRLKDQALNVSSPLPLETPAVQAIVVRASERALKQEAVKLLPPRLSQLATKNGYRFKQVRLKKLQSRWGSCSSSGVITLNYFLMQLPWGLIDYVLVHELIHTKHLNHSPEFWSDFEKAYPSAKQTRKLLKDFRPVLNLIT